MGRRLAGVGVDVIGVARLARVTARQPGLLDRVAAPDERPGLTDAVAAARLWTGKEAVAKILGTGFWQREVGWPEIRVGPRFDGVRLFGAAARVAGASLFTLEYRRDGDQMMAVAMRWIG